MIPVTAMNNRLFLTEYVLCPYSREVGLADDADLTISAR